MTARSTKKDAAKAAATHVPERGHESRVDEMSDERATHLEHAEGPWVRPSSLDAPEPRPGMVQRWIRKQVKGEADPRNWSSAMREGWRPRPADTAGVEWQHFAVADSSAGIIVADDLVLCEMPESRFKQRSAYYDGLTKQQEEAVQHDLSNAQVTGHPIHVHHKTSVTHPARVVGRRVEAADNE